MPRTALTPIVPKGPHPGTVSATDLDFLFTAADVANKNDFALTGDEVILVHNTGGSAHTITLITVNDPQNRLGTIAGYSVGAGLFAVFSARDITGWKQTDGKFYLEANHAEIEFAILKI